MTGDDLHQLLDKYESAEGEIAEAAAAMAFWDAYTASPASVQRFVASRVLAGGSHADVTAPVADMPHSRRCAATRRSRRRRGGAQ